MKKMLCVMMAIFMVTISCGVISAEAEGVRLPLSLQSIHGGIIPKPKMLEHISEIAESNGGIADIYGDGVVIVRKGDKNCLIAGDTVYYVDNGKITEESLYYENSYFMKMPEKALETVLGRDARKSVEYRNILNNYNGRIMRMTGTLDTEYGTIIDWCTGGIMHGCVNELTYVRWDGKAVSITNAGAPFMNVYYRMPYASIAIVDSGTKAVVTYPEIKETYIWSPGAEGRVLRKAGTTVITVDLVSCEAVCEVLPLKSE